MSGLLGTLLGLASPWGYVLVALAAGLESAAFVGLVIPGETAMLLGGVLAFTGSASVVVMMVCAMAGAIAGDSVGYALGRRFGGPLRRSRLGRRVGEQRWDRAEGYVRRRGGQAVFLGRFVGVLRALVPFVAGAARMPYRIFAPCNVLGAVIWAPGFVYLGYLAGRSYQRVERAAGRAGLLLTAGLVLVAAVTLAARWIIRHPHRALAPIRWLRARPGVAWLEHRYAGQLRFLARRFDLTAALGLTLTALLAALGLLGAGFGAVTEDVLAGDELVRVDSPVSRFLFGHREPWLTTLMDAITQLGSVVVLVPVLITLGLIARRVQGTWWSAVFLAATVGGASLSSTVLKVLIARPRPTSGALVQALGYAFPSGHSTAAAAGWLSAAVVAGSLCRSFAVRVRLLAGALLIVVLVGVSRVYLGVHAATDVLAGWALGSLWLALTLTARHLLTARQGRADDEPVPVSVQVGARPPAP